VSGEAVAAQAAELGGLWGAVRVLGTEHPDWWGGLVDLDASASLSAQADAWAAHLTSARGDDQVAIRGGARYALRLERADAALGSRPATPVWRADGAYLITGGFGGVAQQLARQMVRDGARRLVLVGRTPLPPRSEWNSVSPTDPSAARIAFVRELEHAGASVHALTADAGDETQLAAAVGAYNAEGWPAILGVIHAAGALDSRLTGDMDAEAFDRVVHPKLDAAIVLDRIFPQLDVFVLISSMMAFWAPESMANYAAANAGLDALAVARRARGQHAVSIQWGPWESLGLYRATADGATADLVRDGVSAFTGTEGAQFLAPLVAAKEAVIAVVSINWDTFAAARRGREPSIFRDLLAQRSDDAGTGTVKPSNGLRAQLAGVSELTRHSMIEGAVRNALAAVLRRSPGQVDARQPFGTMGLDSLMALELRNRLESAIERSLPATITWNYPTITQLSAHLDTLIGDVSPTAEQPVSASEAAEPAPEEAVAEPQDARPSAPAAFAMENLFSDVAQLSDEDIARALRGG
jgi:NAD(P)-dependent dehydrogenase (short-subunit alcohol dehydrogenase family)/acyl carrier protein